MLPLLRERMICLVSELYLFPIGMRYKLGEYCAMSDVHGSIVCCLEVLIYSQEVKIIWL